MSAGVLVANWLVATRRAVYHPPWASRVILMGCCLPLMAVGSSPVIVEWNGEEGLAMLAAVLVATVLAKWDERLRNGARGELSAGSAFKLGILAALVAAMFQAEELSLMAGGVAAAASLSVQALGWAFPSLGQAAAAPCGRPGGAAVEAVATAAPSPPQMSPPPAPAVEAPTPGPLDPWCGPCEPCEPASIPLAIPVEQGLRGAPKGSAAPLAPLRSTFARVFWSLIAFVLAGGTIVLFVLPLVIEFQTTDHTYYAGIGWVGGERRTDYETYMGVITGCVACLSFLIFALRKTTDRKRVGFWRETVRPFLTAVSMTGMGASITALALGDHILVFDENWAGTIVGLVFSSLLFVVLLFARGRRGGRALPVAGDLPPTYATTAGPVPQGPHPEQHAGAADAAPTENANHDEARAG
jgi:hypothetical protein